jgi:hypothetical protein
MMVLVTTTGYIIEIFGPYFANGNNNDASIVKYEFEKQKEKFSYFIFKDEDAFIVDRGFRDCVEFIDDLGMNIFMPNFLYTGKQHSTEEANNSRLITKVRWIIEAVNGIIKEWLYFKNIVPNNNIPFIGDDFRIVCSLINKFKYPRFKADSEKDKIIAEEMLKKNQMNNLLKERISHISKRIKNIGRTTDHNLIDFPVLSIEYLTELAFGSYQLKQSKSYTIEHLNENGKYEFEIFKEMNDLLRVKFVSRHSKTTVYSTFIEYDLTLIKNWYCTCKAGARVVGCCAHIMSILWYLGYHLKTNDSSCISPKSSSYFSFIDDCKGFNNEDVQIMSDDD